jgi:penicillin-binding protein 2
MKFRFWVLMSLIVLAACTSTGPQATTPEVVQSPTSLPEPGVHVTRAPDAQAAAQAFLEAWQADNYEAMYTMLTRITQDSITLDEFSNRYKETTLNLSLQRLEFQILSSLTNPQSAQVAYGVTFHTSLMGDVSRDMVMNLAVENGQWRVQWEDGMILPELRGGNHLALDLKIPARGNIYDRDGEALAAQADAMALGVIPGEIDDDNRNALLSILGTMTGKTPLAIMGMLEDALPQDYVPIGEVPAQEVSERYDVISGMAGLWVNPFSSRFYYDGGVAPHVTGYVLSIPQEQLEEYQRKGYRIDEKVGWSGLEKWGEDYLTGTRGASLYVTDPNGEIITRLAQTDSQPAYSVYSTIDMFLQEQSQRAIAGFKGAIVVLERDTGRVLAMVSSPEFDPNSFEASNYNSSYLTNEILNSSDRMLLNRATQGGYEPGSVFKLITMSAALETGVFKPEDTYECGHEFTELDGSVFYDWTYDKGLAPSGTLTLPEGLMRSCNPWFYHIGLQLYRQNHPEAITEMARGFGLGSATGIDQVAEDTGNVPYPNNEGDAVQMGIGQATLQVTPLQVANFIAAIGNGGTLYRPQVVERVVSPNGDVAMQFTPEKRGQLPISSDTMQIIRDAMRSVVNNPRGTAFSVFTGISVPVYGKTGTASNSTGVPHAWFAGFTDANREDKPDIAVAVIAENAGEGSEIAAPIFRRVVELYFDGRPGRLYNWESSYYVTKTPTPSESETPTETPPPAPPAATSAPPPAAPPAENTQTESQPDEFVITATPEL